MVSIFDDDAEEVGSEIEAYCPKCKADTIHIINSKFEDEIRRVQCNSCADVHAFRKPRGDAEEEPPEPVSVRKKASKVKPTWDQVMAKASKKTPKLYLVPEQFHENDVVTHPKFGVGFVSEVIGLDKIEITFKEEKRVLVHNRRDISLPPAAYAHVVDTTTTIGAAARALKAGQAQAAKAKAAEEALPKGGAKVAPAGKTNGKAAAPPVVAKGAKPVGKAIPEAKGAAKKPDVKAVAKKPDVKAVAKKPDVKAVAKKPAAKAAAKKPVKAAAPKATNKAAKRAAPKAKPSSKKAAKASKPVAKAKAPARKPAKKPVAKAKARPVAKPAKKPAKAVKKPAKAAKPAKPAKKDAKKAAKSAKKSDKKKAKKK